MGASWRTRLRGCGATLAVLATGAAVLSSTGAASPHAQPHKLAPAHKKKKPRVPRSVDFDMTVTGRFDLARDESDKTASYCTDSAGNAIYGPNEDHYTAHLNFTLQFKKMHLSLRTNDLQTARANGYSSTTWTARGKLQSDTLTGDCSDGAQAATYGCSGTIVDPRHLASVIADTTFVTATTDRFRAVVQPFGTPEYKPDHCLMTDGSSLASENITTWTDPDAGANPFLLDFTPPGVDFPVSDIVHSGTHSEDDKRGSIDCSTDDNDVETDDICLEDETGTQKLTVKTLKVNY
jgi:hypothetical protein